MGDSEMVDYLRFALQDPGGVAAVHRDAAARLPARGGRDPHPRRRGRVPDQQRECGRRAPRGLRRRGGGAALSAPRLPHLEGGGGHPRRAARAARDAAPEARHHLLGRHREGRLPRHHRADQPRRGGDRAPREGTRRGSAGSRWRRPPRTSAGAWPWRWRRICAGWWAGDRRQIVQLRRRAGRARVRRPRARRPRCARSARPRRTTRSTPSGCRASSRWIGRAIRRPSRRRWTPAVARFARDYTAYFEAHNREGATLLDAYPRVVVVGGLGMFTTGKDRRTAGIVSDIYHHTISVLGAATSLRPLRLALGRRTPSTSSTGRSSSTSSPQAPPEKELSRRIALVTGGASGIGRAVALRLAAEGAHVAVTDVDAAGARKVAEEVIAAQGGGPRARAGARRDQRGRRARGLGGGRARLRRARHRGLQCRHRALGAGGQDGAGGLGALVRGELHRSLPRRARVHARASRPRGWAAPSSSWPPRT